MGDSLPSPGTPWPSSAVERAPGAVILEGCSMGEDRKHMGGRERAGCGMAYFYPKSHLYSWCPLHAPLHPRSHPLPHPVCLPAGSFSWG